MTVSAHLADARSACPRDRQGQVLGMRNTAPATTSTPPDRSRAGSGWMSKGAGSSSPVPSAPPQKAFTAGLAKVRVTQKQNGNLPWQP
jgi:hypothetical protein